MRSRPLHRGAAEHRQGSISYVAHQAVKDGLKLAGDDPYRVQVLRARGFIDNDPTQWLKSARALEDELRG
jgi:hypothetical protein